MTTQVLEYLLAIAEEHSLTRAAERFYLSQPSLSHHLANVEKELGVKLFRREGRTLFPTEDGIIFLNNARAVLHAEEQALERIEKLKAEKRLHLQVQSPEAMLPWLNKTVLPVLRQTAPEIVVQFAALPEGELPDSPTTSRPDAVLLLHRDAPPKLQMDQCEVLQQDRCYFAVPSSQGNQRLAPDLSPFCFIRCLETRMMEKWQMESLDQAGLHPKLVCTTADLASVAEMVAAGYGCAFLLKKNIDAWKPQIAISKQIASWQVFWSVYFQQPHHAEHAAALETFLQTLREITAAL